MYDKEIFTLQIKEFLREMFLINNLIKQYFLNILFFSYLSGDLLC